MRFLSLAVLAALLLGVPGTANAQSGRIGGTVRDASGDPVAGVTVRAQGPAATGRATTAADGSYTIANLSPGTYSVTASLPGLRAQVRQNVVVRANSETSLDIVMQAVSPRSARELRKIVSRSDAVWNLPSPPYDADGR